MTTKQTQHPLAFEPSGGTGFLFTRDLEDRLPTTVFRFVKERVGPAPTTPLPLIEYTSLNGHINFNPLLRKRSEYKMIIVDISYPNEIRFFRKYLLNLNQCICTDGLLLGCTGLGQNGEQNQKTGYPSHDEDAISSPGWRRKKTSLHVFTRRSSRSNAERNWRGPEIETCGRLFAYGFKLLEAFEIEGKRYFIAEKVRDQEKELKGSCGNIIRLRRVGKGGKPIHVYKFRTMYPYSQYLQEYVYDQFGLQSGGKMKDDPRVTPNGQFLRKYWLDEIPMLFNLIRGDIKLFGVRPISEHYLSLYPEAYQKYRVRFKPGLIPPFYADLPELLEEIVASEKKYLEAYERAPWRTDLRYFFKAVSNILSGRATSH